MITKTLSKVHFDIVMLNLPTNSYEMPDLPTNFTNVLPTSSTGNSKGKNKGGKKKKTQKKKEEE